MSDEPIGIDPYDIRHGVKVPGHPKVTDLATVRNLPLSDPRALAGQLVTFDKKTYQVLGINYHPDALGGSTTDVTLALRRVLKVGRG